MKKLVSAALIAASFSGAVVAQDAPVKAPAVEAVQAKIDALGWSEGVKLGVYGLNQQLQDAYPNSGLTLVGLQNPRGENVFLVDETGTFMLPINQGQVLTESGLTPMQSVIADFSLNASSAPKWPSHDLPEGVEKTGDLYVFTDPTCGYCGKLESELDEYLQAGVVVHSVPYPRSGIVDRSLPGFSMWEAALCEENPAKAYNEFILKERDVPVDLEISETCTNTVVAGYSIGRLLGVTGTPFLHFKGVSGEMMTKNGYLPANIMLQELRVIPRQPVQQ